MAGRGVAGVTSVYNTVETERRSAARCSEQAVADAFSGGR
jgi:hypothetical protein